MFNEYELSVSQKDNIISKSIKQAVHDIKSPLTCLLMLSKEPAVYPLQERIAIADRLIGNINCILSKIISFYEPSFQDESNDLEEIVVNDLVEKVLAEKKLEYCRYPIEFKSILYVKDDLVIWGFIHDFHRMLSNLINNSVESYDGQPGIVTIIVTSDKTSSTISIRDSGSGMSEEVRRKILNKIQVTANKTQGQGLGFSQVSETLAKYGARLSIESQISKGTKIDLIFPRNNNANNILDGQNIPQNLLSNNVDMVLVDDDKMICESLQSNMFKNSKVDIFNTVKSFLGSLSRYPLDTKILIDYQFKEENINGVEIYKDLYNRGYTQCYLYSGMIFAPDELPEYN